MATIKVAYLKWRSGRPRWEPGPGLRAQNFKGRDLKDEAGRWLGLEAAIAASQELNREVGEWRRNGAPRRAPRYRCTRVARARRYGSVGGDRRISIALSPASGRR